MYIVPLWSIVLFTVCALRLGLFGPQELSQHPRFGIFFEIDSPNLGSR